MGGGITRINSIFAECNSVGYISPLDSLILCRCSSLRNKTVLGNLSLSLCLVLPSCLSACHYEVFITGMTTSADVTSISYLMRILRHSYSANTMALSWNSNNTAMFFIVLLLFLILICFYYVYCTLLSLRILSLIHI